MNNKQLSNSLYKFNNKDGTSAIWRYTLCHRAYCGDVFCQQQCSFEISHPYLHYLDPDDSYIPVSPDIDIFGCDICNIYYSRSTKKSELKLKIMCFCGGLVDDFPCATCPQKICLVNGCSQFVNKKSTILCSEHFRCAVCKDILVYDYYEADFGNCDVSILYYCPRDHMVQCLDEDYVLWEAVHVQNPKHIPLPK